MPNDLEFGQIKGMLTGMAVQYGMKAMLFLVLLYLTWKTAKIVENLILKITERKNLDMALGKFFSSLGRYAVIVMGVITSLGTVGFETATFAAVLAASGFAVGMALQGTLSHFASGVMLLVFRPFDIGHVITVGDATGKVVQIDLFSTILNTPDNKRIVVPNGQVFGQKIENNTFHPIRRVDVNVGTAYNADLDSTRKVILDSVNSIPQVLKDPEAAVTLVGLGSSSIDWMIKAWVNTSDYWEVMDEATRRAKYALDKEGIGIPFPQLDVNFNQPLATFSSNNTGAGKTTGPSMQ